MASDIQTLRGLCLDGEGNPKSKTECRATLINHLILEEMIDVDEAEDLTETTLNELGLWPEESQQVNESTSQQVL
ncbi:MAG: hypothetical protein WC477_04020 [Patescibacteria group bacterium]